MLWQRCYKPHRLADAVAALEHSSNASSKRQVADVTAQQRRAADAPTSKTATRSSSALVLPANIGPTITSTLLVLDRSCCGACLGAGAVTVAEPAAYSL